MRQKTVVLYDPTFPYSGTLPSEEALKQLADCRIVRADELSGALEREETACFVNVHAPYFPKEAWVSILRFLERRGGLISSGGAPFKLPVRREGEAWVIEAEQTTYHQELYIHEMLRVDASKVTSLTSLDTVPLMEGHTRLFDIKDTWNLVPHTTKSSDLPQQMGSSGPMSTQIYPLIKGKTTEGREISAPVVLWENSRGTYAGSRWLFILQPLTDSFWDNGGAGRLEAWSQFCAKGVTELSVKPGYASYAAGEQAVLTIQTQRLAPDRNGNEVPEEWSFDLSVTRSDSRIQNAEDHRNGEAEIPVWQHRCTMQITTEQNYVRLSVPVPIQHGMYNIICRIEAGDGEKRVLRQGYWGKDPALLAEGKLITRSRDYFIKDDRPLPVVGMTYMTSDVARKFLFLPNVNVWDRDMAQMAEAGINWIRTGVWTAYRNIMQVDGHASEEVLRAIDAFLLTAKRHGLQVTFTFFSFTPETWEGMNPYLDPQSVEAQKRFIRSIVSRHTATTHVDWDLINEPSMFDPARIFASGPRSARDPFEKKAFIKWLQQRHIGIERLQEAWNMSPAELPNFGSALIPEPEEINFDVQDMHQAKKGTRWLDYCLFSMDMHNEWASQLVRTIKELCPNHFVTVGQDEALGAQRPSPFFYESAVDYTTVHSWWLNDDLVWDGIFTKTPNKPNVIQETGIMYVETPDGRAKRSELELRSILERKYAYAFSTGGAGAIHWIWNTNYYMDNANESHIGALRADGTEKPEADISYAFGSFMKEIRDLFTDRHLEEIAVVFPYSNDFSNRALAFDATTRLTRILSYNLKQPFRAVSEYHLESLDDVSPKLIIVPSPHNMDTGSLEQLFELVERKGLTMLVTGPIGVDAYWRVSRRADHLLGERLLTNVQREEMLSINGHAFPVSYGHRRIAEVAKEAFHSTDSAASMDQIRSVPLGKGRLLWCPLPIELNGREEPIVKLYRHAMQEAAVLSELDWIKGEDLPGIYGRKLSFDGGALYTFVSEYAWDAPIEIKDKQTGVSYAFLLEKQRSVLYAVDSKGQLISVYRPEEVQIEVKDSDEV
ncbi:beta-galactosidase [Paenibacillus urinalis]|uniref:beta-galactosidase n=1 Tax=Paenibacillus urinalis TaxID=521520 RepID=UPI0019612DE4